MELIRSRPRYNGDLRSRCATKLGSVGGCLDSEFLHSIDRNQTVRATQRSECTERSGHSISGIEHGSARTHSNVRAYTIHHPIVGTRALSIHAKLAVIA